MNEPPATTDPAARLVAILQSALSTSSHQNYLQMWAGAFGVPGGTPVAILHQLDILRDLVDDVERAVLQIPDIRHEQYLKPLPQLREIISRANLQDPCAGELSTLKMIVNALEFSSERLQAYSPEPEIPISELDALQQQAAELLTTLEKSETIPKSLKLILFDLVSSVQRSISEYKFRGIRGVRRELFIIASQIQEHLPQFEKAKEAEEVKGFFKLLKRIDSVTSAALHVKELISSVAPLLPMIPALLEHLRK
jgi:hypothetical protein